MMVVPQEFQQHVRRKSIAARDDGEEMLNLSWIAHPKADATTWVVQQIQSQLPQLTALRLQFNQIGEAGAVALARAIQQGHWPQLTELWLDENGLSIDQVVLDSLDPRQIADAILNGILQPEGRIMFLGNNSARTPSRAVNTTSKGPCANESRRCPN